MKHRLAFTLFAILTLASCDRFDNAGRLKIEHLTSSSGQLTFAPMQHSDSASVINAVPDTFFYESKPYTGAVVQYTNDTLATIVGFLNQGLMDSTWQFFYKSGGLRLEGTMNNGFETGWWRSYYGYQKPQVEKLYDAHGFMLLRKDYYDNGTLKAYQNVKSPLFGDRERKFLFSRKGEVTYAYVEDSVLMTAPNEFMEKVGENMFVPKE